MTVEDITEGVDKWGGTSESRMRQPGITKMSMFHK